MLYRVVAALLSVIALTAPAAAQCEGRWLDGPEFGRAGLGPNAHIRAATEWDPDGPGPEPTRLVVGGSYMPYNRPFLAMWDGAGFRPFGFSAVPFLPPVRALAVYHGRLVVGLYSSSVADPLYVYEWDGTSLQRITTGSGAVLAMTVAHDRLYIGGYFSSVSGIAANGIARWDGVSWSGVGGSGYGTLALTTAANGDVIAGGYQWGVARFDGTAWTTLASWVDSRVRSLIELPDGSIVAGGLFTSINGVPASNIARWDGAAWQAMGQGSTAPVRGLEVWNGQLVAAMGVRSVPSGQAFQLGTWAPAQGWTPLGDELFGATADPQLDDYGPYVLRHFAGRLFVGGGFDTAGAVSSQRAAFMEGGQWVPYGSHFDGSVSEFLVQSASVYAVGNFTRAPGGTPARRAARWNGAIWTALGDGLNGPVVDIEPYGDEILVSGSFDASGASPIGHIARWDGQSWHAFGNMDATVIGTIAAAGDAVYVLTAGTVRKWDSDNSAWVALPTPWIETWPVTVNAIATHAGSLHIAGHRNQGNAVRAVVMKWDGSAWVTLVDSGSGNTPVPWYASRLWSFPGHGLMYTGRGIGLRYIWDGVPIAFGGFLTEGTTEPPYYAAVAVRSGRLAVNGSFTEGSSPIIPLHHITYCDNNRWQPMGDGRGLGSSLCYFGNELLLNAGGPDYQSDISTVWSRWTFDGTPWFAEQPESAAAPCNQPVTLSVIPASGYDPLSFRWQLQDPTAPGGWRDLTDGTLVISGREVAMIADSATPALTVTPLLDFAPPVFRAVVSNTCGSTPSEVATLAITGCAAICDADVNCDGALNGFDIEAMQQAVAGDLSNFCQADPDFNHDGAANGFDIEAVERAVNGVPCP